MPEGDTARGSALVSVRCPHCGTTVYSPQLGRDELLERHRQYCAGTAGEEESRV